MKFSVRIQPPIEDKRVDEVVSQLMRSKEAIVELVRCVSEMRCAKIYNHSR